MFVNLTTRRPNAWERKMNTPSMSVAFCASNKRFSWRVLQAMRSAWLSGG